MEVHFDAELQAKIDKPIEDAVAGYGSELAETRELLDRRYDDLKSDRVKPIPGEEIEAYFREKGAAARRSQTGS